ncbi:hypothetical protein [Rubinisphaera italica]|uniref:Uncharacterized protein n=1 Tax=Rubinisphaera italica TaxID=2527969 RepID=A0A5C5XES2_9PLAN|nr:hypothetical protein [Rubinisphaera italica]TWT60843.1 hypothetical protein Pan54_15700 [Rubinisphaera italica]
MVSGRKLTKNYLETQLERASVIYDEISIREHEMNEEARGNFLFCSNRCMLETSTFIQSLLSDPDVYDDTGLINDFTFEMTNFRNMVSDICNCAENGCNIGSLFPQKCILMRNSLENLWATYNSLIEQVIDRQHGEDNE